MEFEFLEIPEKFGLDPVSYQYFNQLLNHRTIIFNQEVTSDIVESIYVPLKQFEEDNDMTPITMIFNSVGGSVTDGFFLAHYLTHYSKPLKIIVTGQASSMAAILLSAGGKNPNVTRVCYPSTYALIHDGYVAVPASEAKTAEDIMAFNHQVDLQIRDFIINNTNITAELYDSKTRRQWFLTAPEMKELNLIDKIIGCDD